MEKIMELIKEYPRHSLATVGIMFVTIAIIGNTGSLWDGLAFLGGAIITAIFIVAISEM